MSDEKIVRNPAALWDLKTQCYLCGGPLIERSCPAYHWHDAVHKRNRARMVEGLPPEENPPEVKQPAPDAVLNWGPCWVCGEPTDPEGRCTRVNEFFHTPGDEWRAHYHTVTEHDKVGPPCFLIEDFLPVQSIMGIGAFVGQKKTIAALNIAFSLCSGEPLFGKYEVTRRPERVLYLGPENGLISFSDRVNRIGLREHLGKTFFYSTMSMQEHIPLSELVPDELADAVVIIDTAIRYTAGSENDAAQMKEFAKQAFSLIRNGAACVIMLHHSPKSMTKATELTLENSFRGTGELSAFLSVAVAMRTQDMDNEYESPSLFRFVKQRDFEPKPSSFEVTTSRMTCRMTFVDGSNGATIAKKTTANGDGKDEAALQVIKDNPGMSLSKLVAKMSELDIKRSKSWVGNKKNEIHGTGLKTQIG